MKFMEARGLKETMREEKFPGADGGFGKNIEKELAGFLLFGSQQPKTAYIVPGIFDYDAPNRQLSRFQQGDVDRCGMSTAECGKLVG